MKRTSIDDASVERDTSAAAKAATDAADGLDTEVEAILLQAGLLTVALPLGDQTPYLPTYGLDSPCSADAYARPALSEWPFT